MSLIKRLIRRQDEQKFRFGKRISWPVAGLVASFASSKELKKIVSVNRLLMLVLTLRLARVTLCRTHPRHHPLDQPERPGGRIRCQSTVWMALAQYLLNSFLNTVLMALQMPYRCAKDALDLLDDDVALEPKICPVGSRPVACQTSTNSLPATQLEGSR